MSNCIYRNFCSLQSVVVFNAKCMGYGSRQRTTTGMSMWGREKLAGVTNKVWEFALQKGATSHILFHMYQPIPATPPGNLGDSCRRTVTGQKCLSRCFSARQAVPVLRNNVPAVTDIEQRPQAVGMLLTQSPRQKAASICYYASLQPASGCMLSTRHRAMH